MLGPTLLVNRVLLRGGRHICSNLMVFSLASETRDWLGFLIQTWRLNISSQENKSSLGILYGKSTATPLGKRLIMSHLVDQFW